VAEPLSPREEAILLLAAGDMPAFVADVLKTQVDVIKRIGRDYGYPQNRTLKAVALRLRNGDRDDPVSGVRLVHAGALPGCPWEPPTTEPEGQPSAAEATGTKPTQPSREDDAMPIPTAEAFDEAATIADGAGRLAAMADQEESRQTSGVHAGILEDGTAALQLLEGAAALQLQHAERADPLTADQRQRVEVLRAVLDVADHASLGEVLALARWVNLGDAPGGGEIR